MGLFNVDLKGVSEGVGGLIESLGKTSKDIRAAVTGKTIIDPQAIAQLELAAQELEDKKLLAQAEINKIEAANTSIFVSGWRPFLGWVGGIAMALYYIPKFLLGMYFWSIASWKLQAVAAFPDLGITDLLGLLGSLIGMGILRTVEKRTGVARD